MTSKLQKGQSIIELLVAIALTSLLLPALLTGLFSARQGRAAQDQRIEATFLLKEAVEATRSVREKNWSSFAADGTFHPSASGSAWMLISGSEIIHGYTRQIVIAETNRDSSGSITAIGGTADPSTKKVTITVSWPTPFFSSVSQTLYLTRYINTSYTETTVADFNAGTKTNVVVTQNGDGEVQLAPSTGGRGDWCDPSHHIANTFNLSGQGITTAISAIPSHAYTTTGGNASGHSLDSIDISDPPPPATPSASNESFYDNYKTYGIFADSAYSYLTSDHPGLTVDIVQVTSKPYSQTGTFNGGGKGDSVYVSGNTGYVTVGSTFYSFDLTNKTGARPQLGSIALAGSGKRVVVSGTYAFVATSSTTNQLQIVDVSNPSSMSLLSSLDLKNGLAGVDLALDPSGNYAYMVTTYTSGKSDFYIIDVTNKSSPKALGTYSTNGMTPKGVTAVTNRAIIVGSGGILYQVLKTGDVNNPIYCGGVTPPGVTSINAVAPVAEVDGDAYSYILTDNANTEFQIIEGGPGGQFIDSGTFESQTFTATTEAAFNRFEVTAASPSATNLIYQIAIQHAISGSCNGVTFNYVGPDATANTRFTSSSAIPVSADNVGFENPGRCMRYKAFFATNDPSQSPVLYDISFNYSP